MSDEITDLQQAGEELLATARESSDGRSSRAVVHGDRMRAVLMALVNGTGLGEHDAPAAATFQVVSGRARLIAGDQVWEVPAGSGGADPAGAAQRGDRRGRCDPADRRARAW